MRPLPRIAGEGRAKGIALVALLALGQAAAAGLAAFATRDVFAALGGFREAAPAGLPLVALGLIALVGLATAALRVGERVVAERVGQSYAASLRLALFSHLAGVSARELAKRRSGALAMRFVGDLAAVRGWVSLGIARGLSAGIVLPLAGGCLFLLDPALGTAAALPILAGILALCLAGPRLGPIHRRLRARRARLAADMTERIPHAPELRLLGRTGIERDRIKRRTETLVEAALARAQGAALLRAVPDAVSGLAAAAILLSALRSGVSGAEAAGALAALALMIQPMRDLAGLWDRHRAWVAARDKCAALLSVPVLDRPPRPAGAPSEGPPRLHFAGVSAGRLQAIEAEAEPGQRIAIVGGNGMGKSTLLSLAAGLEQPEAGEVTLDGIPPRSLSAPQRRRLIAHVGARSPILAGSLRRALTMGADERPDDATILRQAEAYGLAEVVARLGGLDGKLAEAGRNLSAGEARRVMLVRAALSGSGLLLLDEPDDALDVGGRELVERLLRERAATALLVTHDLELARRLDRLWLIEDGRLLEAGEPEALLAGDGPTARFFAARS